MSIIFIHFIWILAGFVTLYYGSEFLVKGASEISLKLGISPLIVGLTVVAFGTSAPELLVCLEANAADISDQAFGTIIGSNICNIALILGVSALINPVSIDRQIIRREIPILFVSTVVFMVMLFNDDIARWEGMILFAGIIIYVITSLRMAKDEVGAHESEDFSKEDVEAAKKAGPAQLVLSVVWIALGFVALKFGSEWLIEHGTKVAQHFGISMAIIGLILLAFGTSLPELATSIVAARKGQSDMLTGNAVGSCIFNLLAVIGITATVKRMEAVNINWIDLGVMAGVIVLIASMMRSKMSLSKKKGFILLSIYLGYTITKFVMPPMV